MIYINQIKQDYTLDGPCQSSVGGNKYTTSNEPKEKTVVQLKYMGKAYQASMSNASRAVTALTYRGVSYSN